MAQSGAFSAQFHLYHRMTQPENTPPISKEWQHVLQLARLGVDGKTEDFVRYLKRISPSAPGVLGAQLRRLSNSAGASIRGKTVGSPVDSDSQLGLVRVELSPKPKEELFYNSEVSRQLQRFVVERQKSKLLLRSGLKPSTSLLFAGPPGVGKSQGARWIAQSLELPLYVLDLATVISSYLGKTGQNLREVLSFARSSPSVLLLDEFDALGRSRSDVADVSELQRLVNIILVEIEDWPPESVLIAATNFPDLLDQAIWRRFDDVVRFERPDAATIERQLVARLGQQVSRPFIEVFSSALVNLSNSEIDTLTKRAQRHAVLHQSDLEEAFVAEIRPFFAEAGKDAKKSLVETLHSSGCSQRRIEELTGFPKSTVGNWLREK